MNYARNIGKPHGFGSRARLLIADDHSIFVEALRLLLEQNYEVVGVVTDGRALVSQAPKLAPDVIIVDVGMPLLNGFDAACRVKEQMPNLRVIFLTMQEDPLLAAAAADLGAGFVLKESASSELLTAIDCVLRGKLYVTPKLKAEDWVAAKARVRQFSRELTSRQREIVQLCAEGRPIKEIAGLLNLSEKTIEFHKYHIMEVYGLKNTADIVLFALKLGLISMNSAPKV
jgi:DNA-binding NarL/FixJ family response regulator